MSNLVSQVRPSSRFDSYEPGTESQQEALERFTRLAAAITNSAEKILSSAYPFEHGRFIFVSGNPGVGKTHLLEALINEVTGNVPELARRIYLFRGRFTVRNISGISDFDKCPIVVVDDLYAEYQTIDDLHPRTDIKVLMEMITMVYEKRQLVIFSSNFPLMEGIEERIRSVDTLGRTTSRLKELLANSGEMEIQGEDHRRILATKASTDDIFGEL